MKPLGSKFYLAAKKIYLLCHNFLRTWVVPNRGKRKSAGSGDRNMPKAMEEPKRWVGGKLDKINIPKLVPMMVMEYEIGFRCLEQTLAQASQSNRVEHITGNLRFLKLASIADK